VIAAIVLRYDGGILSLMYLRFCTLRGKMPSLTKTLFAIISKFTFMGKLSREA
jgi:hypothetical protein